jgi:hypothetical protein
MGNQERARTVQQNIIRAAAERMIGDPIPFGGNDEGCPKCGAGKEYHKPNYCFGEQKLIEDLPCKIPGEHLHTVCNMCNHMWLQRCKDWNPAVDPERKYLVGVDPAEEES